MTGVNGFRAVWDGAEYDASPDGELVRLYAPGPAPGFDLVAAHRYRRMVLAADVEWLGYVRTTASVAGRPVVVVDVVDGRALIEYHDADGWQPECGPEIGVWRVWVSEAELTNRAEHRFAVR
jgi:hypothetical protein